MNDQELADAVKKQVAGLNAAIKAATVAGLAVEVKEAVSFQSIGERRHQLFAAEVARPL